MATFWASGENKKNLQALLHKEAIAQENSTSPSVQIVASYIPGEYPSCCLSILNGCTSQIPELHNDIEEADCRIIPYAMHATNHGTKCIIVLSTDSDVVVLMLHYWSELKKSGLQELWVKTGVADSTHFIPGHSLASVIGADVCRVLPAVHCLTGCDYTTTIGTKNAAIEAKPCQYLLNFGFSPSCQNIENQISNAEEYLVKVLKKGTNCKTMNQLRNWMYHHNKRQCIDDLPPTSYSIQAHIQHVYYATHPMITLLDCTAVTLNPTEYGYLEEGDLLLPKMAIQLIAEEYAVHGNCVKCANIRCHCRKKENHTVNVASAKFHRIQLCFAGIHQVM